MGVGRSGTGTRGGAAPTIIADTWYADELRGVQRFEDRIPARLKGAADRSGIVRGLILAAVGLRADAVVTTNPAPEVKVCVLIYGVLGLRRLVLLEYIVHPPQDGAA